MVPTTRPGLRKKPARTPTASAPWEQARYNGGWAAAGSQASTGNTDTGSTWGSRSAIWPPLAFLVASKRCHRRVAYPHSHVFFFFFPRRSRPLVEFGFLRPSPTSTV
jgi:hypothetical protein